MKGNRRTLLWAATALVVVVSMALPWTVFAYVTTDKPDYAPGEVVTISGDNRDGAGYLAGEIVHVDVQGPNGYTAACEGVADANGAWSCQVTLWNNELAVGEYTYTATGVSSGVSESGTFFDSVGDAWITSPTTASPVTVTSLPATVTISFNYWTSAQGTTAGEAWVLGTTAYNSKTLASGGTAGSPKSDSIVVTIPAGTANGSYNAKVTVTNSYGTGANSKTDVDADAVIVNVPTCTPPQVTGHPANQTVTYGAASVSFSAAASGNPTPTVQWQLGTGSPVVWSNISGATSSPLIIASPTVAMSGNQYRAVFTNDCGGTQTATSNAATLTVNKANPTCTISGYTGVYDGDPHGASGSCTGVNGETLAGLDLGASFTNVPGGTANWTFTDETGNYNDASGSVGIVISKANATIAVTPYHVTYDGDPHTATGTATGVKGESLSGLNLSGTTHTNAGDYPSDPWTFTDVTGNYNDASGTVHDIIDKADAVCTVIGYNVPQDCLPHTATGSCKGVKGETLDGLDLTGTTHTDVGDYPTDPWTFTDVTGNYNDDSGTVHDVISNVPPTITSISGPAAPVNIDEQPVTIMVSFSGPGCDTYEVLFDWGDGTDSTVPSAMSPTSAGHTYGQAGVYRVTVTVTDNDGGSDTEVYEFVVVYDPDAGFVTGGGWIMSPAGAYQPNLGLSGKATFGFVSKYLKGAKVPTGNTEFQFHAAGFNFKSTVYEWLVVSGSQAQYKGSGTVNGRGNYGFLLTAGDGAPDTFRLKVWDKDNGDAPVYDNGSNQPLGSGSIIIHTGKK